MSRSSQGHTSNKLVWAVLVIIVMSSLTLCCTKLCISLLQTKKIINGHVGVVCIKVYQWQESINFWSGVLFCWRIFQPLLWDFKPRRGSRNDVVDTKGWLSPSARVWFVLQANRGAACGRRPDLLTSVVSVQEKCRQMFHEESFFFFPSRWLKLGLQPLTSVWGKRGSCRSHLTWWLTFCFRKQEDVKAVTEII